MRNNIMSCVLCGVRETPNTDSIFMEGKYICDCCCNSIAHKRLYALVKIDNKGLLKWLLKAG